jgi:hypothetical protein
MAETKPGLRDLLVVPTLITLAVTVLRLVGEMARWSPALFNREAGGPLSLVGIVWLIPVFGVVFALRLLRAGEGPSHAGMAAGWAAAGFALNTALLVAAIKVFPTSPVAQLAVFGVGSWAAIALARPGWPALWRVLLAYGFAARIPVLVVMLFAIFREWDSHYAKPRPDFPPMGHWGLFWWTAFLPQMSIWIYLTVVLGILSGAAAVGLKRLAGGKRGASLTSPA